MKSLRRMYVSFVLLFNVFSFGVIFLILTNSSAGDEVVFIGEGDGEFAFVLTTLGIVVNIGLAYVLLRGNLDRRRLETDSGRERRPKITGE
ncbi:hypothetical protein BH20CHL3_BH20CHL3_14450 [soil metagenome]